MRAPLRLSLPVADCAPLEPSFRMSGRLWLPDSIADDAVLLCCLPGGGMNHRYFDLRTADGDDRFSFAERMRGRGYLVAAFDHPGTGESHSEADRFELTPRVLGQANLAAVSAVTASLRTGECDPSLTAIPGLRSIGLAHSMGALVTILAQAESSPHDALVLLGFSTRGLPEFVPPSIADSYSPDTGVAEARLVEWSRSVFGTQRQAGSNSPASRATLFGTEHADPEGLRSLRSAIDNMLPTGAMQAMLPGNVQRQAAQITAPVLSIVGDADMTGPAADIPGAFSASADSRLEVIEQTGHCHFVFPNRDRLCDAIDRWIMSLPPTTPN